MVADYDPDEREARVYGRFMYFSSHIYPTFNYDIHTVPNEHYGVPEIPPGSVLKMVNDPKDGRPDAVVWAWQFPNGRIYIENEYPIWTGINYWDIKTPVSIDQLVEAWYNIEIVNDYKKPRRIMDRRFGWQTRGDTALNILYLKAGMRLAAEKNWNGSFSFVQSYSVGGNEPEVQYGHKMVRHYFEVWPDGLPGILIHRRCRHMINANKHYIRRRDTTKASQYMATTDMKIVEKFKDFNDVERYLVCDGKTTPRKQETKRPRRSRPQRNSVFDTI